jgi:UDPglucose--hexose-1-phosphate uridylyltransferase
MLLIDEWVDSLKARIDGKLFDGRDIFYFDDESSALPNTRKSDSREPAGRPQTAQLRFDALSSEWITVASHRQQRAFLPPAHSCPLCPTTQDNLSELPDQFDVAVFENKGPAFGPEANVIDLPNGERFGFSTTSYGRCEVVVFSPDHVGSLSEMPVERVETVIRAWMNRTAELQQIKGVVQVFPFENRGEEIGVTLHHPHGQIYAYPFVTPRTQKLIQSVDSFSGDFFAELVKFEKSGNRTILETENFLAFVPFAARWPIEAHLLPKRQINDLSQLTADEAAELAQVYKRLLQAFDSYYETPTPYISAWHQAPMIEGRENIRLMLQITSPRRAADKLKYLAGSESAMGAFVADIAPEETAARLREVI